MNRTREILVILAAACSFACIAFVIARVSAGGTPTSGALTYAGTLEDAAGAPLSGEYRIQINLWNSPEPADTPLCQTQPKAYPLERGRFAIQLPDACTDAIRSNTDVWTEVLVNGTSLGATKLGAVPYAVEASHASSADHATSATNAEHAATASSPSGALSAQLNGASARVTALEGRIAALESAAITAIDIHYATSQDDFQDECVSNPLYCGIASTRRCLALGYRGGWFVGETPDSFASFQVACVK